MQDERDIWDAFRSGDESSLQVIFDKYYFPLFNYGHRFSADNHLIEDALQELFVKLWKNRDSIKETGSVKNYLYKSFRRVLLRLLDARQRKYTFSVFDEWPELEQELAYDHTIISRERLENIRRNLKAALEKMTPRQREIIHLRYYEEMEYDEIAALMQLSVSSTYKLLYKAIDTLRQYLSKSDLLILLAALSLKKI
ncbi:RNA polymerase sigma factor, sigma-70 family [Chitinophaga terrae (ex Kim and Jung 2007)]|jgi:RNA polymerase sigma factor (sigma-70 family)|uniref:RNA polymerase sigma factor, sigma-70 family n=1 Tax=Chitinophaga terrae (ex Kim and Jung 2007) TaxID=408074 RepID=A0A1H3YVS5_9BACT|nr:sigma-70 family RNA polymerase sigma factor [Chitinophaga terrae (ex Kim and Jung 2007)]SEA15510.1 RNA polymerase sigma factor, sigma-70 family [Chitinophaga terrae (ex Kim and Jung 2007)]